MVPLMIGIAVLGLVLMVRVRRIRNGIVYRILALRRLGSI